MAGQSKPASTKCNDWQRPRKVGEHQNFALSKKEMENTWVEIDAYCKLHGLHRYDENGVASADHPQITGMVKGTKGEDNTLENIEKQYKPYWNELYRFCVKIKDWRSAAIFSDEQRPENPIPADPWTIELFFLLKTEPKGKLIEHPHTLKPCMWWPRYGKKAEQIVGTDKWKAESNIKHLHTAVQMCHIPFPKCNGNYSVPCNACWDANRDFLEQPGLVGHNWKMCRDHSATGAILTCYGDPLTEHYLSKAYTTTLKRLNTKHKVKGALQLNAKQVWQVRMALLSGCGHNTVKRFQNFQTYTMILLGIKLFLRADELIMLHLSQSRTHCIEVDREKKTD